MAGRLEQEQLDGRPLTVWFDKWDIDFGENILSKIEEGLKGSRFLAVVLSPAFTKAAWPTMEWQSQVYADPAGRLARILPILLRKFDAETGEPVEIPLPLRPLKYFDFTDPRHEEREYQRLLAKIRGEKPPRGPARPSLPDGAVPSSQEEPDAVEETLASNLLPVAQAPVWLFSDLSTARKKQEVWDTLRGRYVPPFLLHGGRLYSFYSPDDRENPFTRFLSRTDPLRERTSDWMNDEVKRRLLTYMYNDAFREHCYRLRIRTPKQAARARRDDRFQYFCPSFDSRPRVFTWGVGTRPRELAKVLPQPNGTLLGVHYAAKIRFITLADELFLLLEPGWMFTDDGVDPLQGKQMGVLSTKWGGKERNATILRHVLMWGLLLSEGQSKMEVDCGGGAKLILDGVPAQARTRAGILGDEIRLDRLLGNEGAGEILTPENELDAVAALHTGGEISGAAADEEDEDSDPVSWDEHTDSEFDF